METVFHPWKCERCGRIYESLDRPAQGQGNGQEELLFVCSECNGVNLSLEEYGDGK